MNTTIKEHPRFVGYGFDENGNPFSRHLRGNRGGLTGVWLPLKTWVVNGYPAFSVHSPDGKQTSHLVHAAVLETFVGPKPDGLQCCHNNGIRTDNRPSNLRYDTVKNNHADKILHGTTLRGRAGLRGEANGSSRLNDAKVKEIRAAWAMGETQTAIAKRYGVSQPMVGYIVRRERWTHIE